DAQQLQIENQYRVRRNQRAWALFAVGQFARDIQFVLLADMHQLQAFDPAWNDAADRQVDRATALDRAVEDGAVYQATFIVNGDHIVRSRLSAVGLLDDFVLESGFGGFHTFALGVVFEKLIASRYRFLVHF